MLGCFPEDLVKRMIGEGSALDEHNTALTCMRQVITNATRPQEGADVSPSQQDAPLRQRHLLAAQDTQLLSQLFAAAPDAPTRAWLRSAACAGAVKWLGEEAATRHLPLPDSQFRLGLQIRLMVPASSAPVSFVCLCGHET